MNQEVERAVAALCANLRGRTDATAEVLREAAVKRGFWISADGRVGESDLAVLLGIAPGTLANKRREGTAPSSFQVGGGGHRITYRLHDAAEWLESQHDG